VCYYTVLTLQNVVGRASCDCRTLLVWVCGAILCGIWPSVVVHELQCSGFWPSMIAHFNTTASAFHNWSWWIGTRPLGWWISLPHCPAIAQSLISISLRLAVSEVKCFRALLNKTSFLSLSAFSASKKYILVKTNVHTFYFLQVNLCFYDSCFVSSWNQTEVLHWKLILVFVTVLSVPVHHTHTHTHTTVLYSAIF
jgi:hypothetical protein